MKQFYLKIVNSHFYRITKSILTMDGDKKFIISSLSYYLLISFIPMLVITYFFLKLLNIEESFVLDILQNFMPLEKLTDIISDDYTVESKLNSIISISLGSFIASKGILNYFYYINEKFNLKSFKYGFVINRLYACLLTICMSVSFAIMNGIIYFLKTFNNPLINILMSILSFLFTFIFILLFNYFLLKRHIKLCDLCLGSLVSTILYNISSFFLNFYFLTFDSKEKYYGFLTNVVIYLFFVYLLIYFFSIGNQISYLLYKYKYYIYNLNRSFLK